MEENRMYKKLALGFENSLTMEQRDSFAESSLNTDEVFNLIGKQPDKLSVEQCMTWLEKDGHNVMFHDDLQYPDYDPIENRIPYMLFYVGAKPDKSNNMSIVGTRYPDGTALQEAFRLGFECCMNKIGVVTGLAEGIDQAAACGGVSAFGICMFSRVIGVLGCGLEYDYPRCSSGLKRRIVESGGSIVSQFAPYMPPYKQNFPNRNVTVAAYGRQVIVVQAPYHSGALITSDFALQMGKDVAVSCSGVKPGRINLGSFGLHEDGAAVVQHISDIADVQYIAQDTEKPVVPFTRYCDKFYNVLMVAEN